MSPPQGRNCAASTGRSAFAGQFASARRAVKQNALAKRNFTFVNMCQHAEAVFAAENQFTIMAPRNSKNSRTYGWNDHDERALQPRADRRPRSGQPDRGLADVPVQRRG